MSSPKIQPFQPNPHDLYGGSDDSGAGELFHVVVLLRSGHTIRTSVPAAKVKELMDQVRTFQTVNPTAERVEGGSIDLPNGVVLASEIVGVVRSSGA